MKWKRKEELRNSSCQKNKSVICSEIGLLALSGRGGEEGQKIEEG